MPEKRAILGTLTAMFLASSVLCARQSVLQPLPADQIVVTLEENPRSNLPLEPSCGGEGGLTLTCRAFLVTLENRSSRTIHLRRDCAEPRLLFERKAPSSSSGWWPVSQRDAKGCAADDWKNIRLRPGESTVYETRLISPRREAEAIQPGSYTLRAEWTLVGCADTSDADCLGEPRPRTVTLEPIDSAPLPAFPEPVKMISNEVSSESPPLPEMGTAKVALDVTARPATPDSPLAKKCERGHETTIDCTVFHYKITNLGPQAIRYVTMSCSNPAIVPQYSVANDQWKPVAVTSGWMCFRNAREETPILPGASAEKDFTFVSLLPFYDVRALRNAQGFRLRFLFDAPACIASPDGRFCITKAKRGSASVSQAITLPVE